jgi:hypothetical protein
MTKSYKMRMYHRRLWQQRTQIVLTGLALWIGIAAIILLVTEVAQ